MIREGTEELNIGDQVKGASGINTVRDFAYQLMKPQDKQKLISINNSEYFITNNHPVLTKGGWKAYDLGEPDSYFAESYAYDILKDNMEELKVGDIILGPDGQETEIKNISILFDSKTYKLMTPVLTGDHTFYANGFLVIGFEPDKAGAIHQQQRRHRLEQPGRRASHGSQHYHEGIVSVLQR